MCQKKHPPFENLKRDDHSSKNQLKRVETDFRTLLRPSRLARKTCRSRSQRSMRRMVATALLSSEISSLVARPELTSSRRRALTLALADT